MAASSPVGDEPLSPVPGITFQSDPFDEPIMTPIRDSARQRFGQFDSQLLALGPNASPEQAKRALEAHLAETDRRMEEAGRLGTALVAQRKELEERLEEVINQQAEGELSDELKEKLVEIEREYIEVARESARAFLPKPRVPSNEAAGGSPFVPEGKGGRRSVSPSKFEAQASATPTKLGVPNRKLRNQPAQRVHDIEFAAEISTSLIAQVRNLQAMLAEKEEELRDVKIEKSRLEYDAEGFQQRLKALDESEGRYKDENWSLETQVHELMAAQKEAADREKKLQQTINVLQSEKNSAQREIDEVKMTHAKLVEEHTATIKTQDVELGAAKRNLVMADSERSALHRKIEDLTNQNQELAKAISAQRARTSDRQETLGVNDEDFESAHSGGTPEHSPPPSPIKGTPRHSMLESETLKTSLAHAQRTIQSLRTNVHREKTEKLELRRMLQDARDELEKARQDPMPTASRRTRKSESREFKKLPPRLLGNVRTVRSEIYIDEEDWETQTDDGTVVNRSVPAQRPAASIEPVMESIETDDFETANEASDHAFETAHERDGNTTDDFQTGAEGFSSSDEDDLTETESPSKRRPIPGRRPSAPLLGAEANSFQSTASTDDEYAYGGRTTPTQMPPLQARFPVRVNRGAYRRSRQNSEEPAFQPTSPISYAQRSVTTTPQRGGVTNLAAELGDYDGSDNDSTRSATPVRNMYHSRPGSVRGRTMSPPPALPRLPRPAMVENGMMTEPDAEREKLKLEHARHIELLHAENAAAHATAMDSLKAIHVKSLSRALDQARSLHAQELEHVMSTHDELAAKSAEASAAHVAELEALRADHDAKIAQIEAELKALHASELETLKANHQKELASVKKQSDAAHAAELASLVAAHEAQIDLAKKQMNASHAEELESLKATHAEAIASMKADADAEMAKQLDLLKDSHSKELASLKESHSSDLEALRAEHTAASAQELEGFKAALSKQLESTKSEGDAAHSQQLEAINAAHSEIVEAHKRESAAAVAALESAKASHERQLESLRSEHAAAKSKQLEELTSSHEKQVQAVIEEMSKAHEEAMQTLKGEAAVSKLAALEKLSANHGIHIQSLSAEAEALKAKELDQLSAMHAEQLKSQQAEHETAIAKLKEEMEASHELKLKALASETDASQARELEALRVAHEKEVATLRDQHEASRAKELDELNMRHSSLLESLRTEHMTTLDQALANLKANHEKDIDALNGTHATTTAAALEALKLNHAQQLDVLKSENEAALARQLESIREEHRSQLEAHQSGALAEKEELLAAHTLELEALRKSLAVARPSLKYSTISAVSTEPTDQTTEESELLRSPKREAFILPRDLDQPQTPTQSSIGVLGRRGKDKDAALVIAEDETRQSPSSVTAGPETPESQRPFKEMSTNTDARPSRKPKLPTLDHSSQTALTSEGIDHLMMKKHHQRTTSSDSAGHTPYRHQRGLSQDSMHGMPGDSGLIAGAEPIPTRLPGSSTSAHTSTQTAPPLPPNHREAIEAARTGSSSGAKGAMGPPPVPVSPYKNPGRPWTPRENRPMSPASFHSQPRGTPTPRPGRTTSTLGLGRSRQSSLSSFTSELETRFNPAGGAVAMDMADLAGTDPRMIQAITQTMIGEYLWKYTRKAGRGEISENRHRRYFWVHPYTRTLYWSNSDPSAAGKTELKAKSVPIEAVRVVTDDNPMPPGLHRKSLVIISPGRTIKFTCTTGQRHETWFNALSYLLLRTDEEGQVDTEEMAGNLTQEDVDEFNPAMGQRPVAGNRPRAPPSLSSYNSLGTRNESPNMDMMAIPTLTPTNEKGTGRPRTVGRLSRYSGSFMSSIGRRSRTGLDNAIYEASEVNDSAEELRQIIEQQDRESDRLENVRACCDGKHDVGTLSHSSKRNRNSSSNQLNTHNHAHPGRSATPTPSIPTLRSRG